MSESGVVAHTSTCRRKRQADPWGCQTNWGYQWDWKINRKEDTTLCLFCSISLNAHFILVLYKKESCFMQHGPVPIIWSIINTSMLSEVIIFIKGLCIAIQIICFVFLLFETRSHWVTHSKPPDWHASTSSQMTLRYIGFRGWECSLGGRVLA